MNDRNMTEWREEDEVNKKKNKKKRKTNRCELYACCIIKTNERISAAIRANKRQRAIFFFQTARRVEADASDAASGASP